MTKRSTIRATSFLGLGLLIASSLTPINSMEQARASNFKALFSKKNQNSAPLSDEEAARAVEQHYKQGRNIDVIFDEIVADRQFGGNGGPKGLPYGGDAGGNAGGPQPQPQPQPQAGQNIPVATNFEGTIISSDRGRAHIVRTTVSNNPLIPVGTFLYLHPDIEGKFPGIATGQTVYFDATSKKPLIDAEVPGPFGNQTQKLYIITTVKDIH